MRTNNSGKFSFTIPTGTQSEYSITLVFQKKNYETRRFSWTANRSLTEKDIQNQYKAEAVKPFFMDYSGPDSSDLMSEEEQEAEMLRTVAVMILPYKHHQQP